MLLAIDPGPTESAFVVFDGKRVERFGKLPNHELLTALRVGEFGNVPLYIEMIASYGMPVGETVFQTCVWIGRYSEAFRSNVYYITRMDVRMHVCHSPKANDSTIRQALIDRFGPGKEAAIGQKKRPGPLYGVSGDVWAALGVAVTAWDTKLKPFIV